MDPSLSLPKSTQNVGTTTSSTATPEINSKPNISNSGEHGPRIDMKNEPLQLIEFLKTPDRTITLRQETIDHICRQIGDRHVSIISICGPSRQGKSFLLNYMIRRLEGLEKADDDWIGREKKRKPLTGFKFRSGEAPETQWIWVWSRPFIVKNDEGKEVAIILVETQGTYDEFTTKKDMSIIVGLSLLTSSVTIFNCFRNLQEDVILDLNTYIEYGRSALDMGDDSGPPFQKLCFLITDWNNPTEFTYGFKGGKQFLDEMLRTKEGQPPQAKHIRETIRNCFQELDCFLMPSIGEKAPKEFQGSVSEFNPNFAKKMEEFLNDLIGPENLTIKEIMGSPVSAQELRTWLEKYVEIFNSVDVPSAENMWQATSQMCNNTVLEKVLKEYRALMKKKKSSTYISEEDLEEAHSKAEKQALELFRKTKKFGTAEVVSKFEETLKKRIETELSEMQRQNKDKRDKIIGEASKDDVQMCYSQLEDYFPLKVDDITQLYAEPNMKTTSDMNKVTGVEEQKLSTKSEETIKNPHKNKMDKLQKRFIKENLSELIQNTNCTPELLSILQTEKLLCDKDIKHLNMIKHQRAKAAELYDLLQKKVSSFQTLQNVMQEAGQTTTCSILDRCQVSNIFRYRSICYQRSLLIGKGRYGSNVYRGEYGSKEVAVKKIYLDHNPNKSQVEGKVESLIKSQSHPRDRVIRYFQAEYGVEFILIAMELATTNLNRWVRETLKEYPSKLMDLLGQITDGVAHLHSMGIIHGNLHPANVLISVTAENNIFVRISDFGLLNTIKYEARKKKIFLSGFGTGGWMAPEVIRYIRGDNEEPDNSADIFSLGCLFYYVLTGGKHPFGADIQQMGNILNGTVVLCESEFTVKDFGALGFIWLIRQMVSQRQMERPSASAILSHPVFWPNERVAQILHDVVPFVDKHSAILDNCGSFVTHNGTEPGRTHGDFDVIEKYLSLQGHPKEIRLTSLLKSIPQKGQLQNTEDVAIELDVDYFPHLHWLSQFPYLLPVTWTVFQAEQDATLIQNYYEHHSSCKFNLVRKSGNMFEIFPLPQLDSKENRRTFLDFAKAVFKSKLKEQLPLETQDEPSFYDDTFIQKIFWAVTSEMLDDIHLFLSSLGEKAMTEFEHSFEEIWKFTLDSYLTKNKEHREKAETVMNSVVKGLLSNFRGKLEQCISQLSLDQSEIDGTKLEQAFQNFKSTQLQYFEMTRKSYRHELHNKYLANLEESMTSIFTELKNRHADQVQPENVLDEDINQYEVKLTALVYDGQNISEAGLRMIHSLKVESVLDKLQLLYPLNDPNAAEMKGKLQDRLDKIFSNMLAFMSRDSTGGEPPIIQQSDKLNKKFILKSVDDSEEEIRRKLEMEAHPEVEGNVTTTPNTTLSKEEPCPIQLIRFAPKEVGTTIELQQDALEPICLEIGDRPVCVISICGPSRQGKSFLLGYLMRRLVGLEQGLEDWMGWDDVNKPLKGFTFRNGRAPETKGIWIWSKPFIIKTEEDKEVAVLLLDTQGTYDEFTTFKDMSAIVGLSLLMSSVTIFNIFTNLQEDILVALDTYTQYGNMVSDQEQSGGPPFQKLTFLIRDFNNPDEFPYGDKGGENFLNSVLEVNRKHSAEAKHFRENIRNCFQELGCFLMPSIGEKALFIGFKGSIAELNPRFAIKMEEFINNLVCSGKIFVKTILGKPVRASQLKTLLETYIEIFNSDEVPSAETMWQATAQLANQNVLEKSMNRYHTHMKAELIRSPYLSEGLLNIAHSQGELDALNYFRKSRKVGSPQLVSEFEEKLATSMGNAYSRIKEENSRRQEAYITTATRDASNHFRSKLGREFPFPSSTVFYDVLQIKAMAKREKYILINSFNAKLAMEEENKHWGYIQSLLNSLRTILDNHLNTNHINFLMAERHMTHLIEDLVNEYTTKLREYFGKNKYEEGDMLKQALDEIKSTVLHEFRQQELPGGEAFHRRYVEKLETLIEANFNMLTNEHKINIERDKAEAMQCVGECYNMYRKKFEFGIQNETTIEGILLCHHNAKSAAASEFNAKHRTMDPHIIMQCETDLLKMIEESFQEQRKLFEISRARKYAEYAESRAEEASAAAKQADLERAQARAQLAQETMQHQKNMAEITQMLEASRIRESRRRSVDNCIVS